MDIIIARRTSELDMSVFNARLLAQFDSAIQSVSSDGEAITVGLNDDAQGQTVREWVEAYMPFAPLVLDMSAVTAQLGESAALAVELNDNNTVIKHLLAAVTTLKAQVAQQAQLIAALQQIGG